MQARGTCTLTYRYRYRRPPRASAASDTRYTPASGGAPRRGVLYGGARARSYSATACLMREKSKQCVGSVGRLELVVDHLHPLSEVGT